MITDDVTGKHRLPVGKGLEMNRAKLESTENKVFCPTCRKQFLAIPGAECYCVCGTAFQISVSKDGLVQLAVSRGRQTGGQIGPRQ